jgi:hypothetical protein
MTWSLTAASRTAELRPDSARPYLWPPRNECHSAIVADGAGEIKPTRVAVRGYLPACFTSARTTEVSTCRGGIRQ